MKPADIFVKIGSYLFISTLLHLFFLWNLNEVSRSYTDEKETFLVKIVPMQPPASVAPPVLPPKPIPPRPVKPHKLPKKTKHRIATERHPQHAKSNTPPVQGLNKDSFAKSGKSTFQAPVGNTLLTGDTGIRKTSVGDMQGDLSQRAHRLTLVKPEYTEEALQSGLEGEFVADVFVDETGHVKEVSLQKKIGYGMDAKLEAAAKSALYAPRKDAMGHAVGGWDQIVFQLVLP